MKDRLGGITTPNGVKSLVGSFLLYATCSALNQESRRKCGGPPSSTLAIFAYGYLSFSNRFSLVVSSRDPTFCLCSVVTSCGVVLTTPLLVCLLLLERLPEVPALVLMRELDRVLDMLSRSLTKGMLVTYVGLLLVHDSGTCKFQAFACPNWPILTPVSVHSRLKKSRSLVGQHCYLQSFSHCAPEV